MILTTSIEWNDRAFVELPIPLFDAEPLVASHRRHGPG
jgi:hypothetical protein